MNTLSRTATADTGVVTNVTLSMAPSIDQVHVRIAAWDPCDQVHRVTNLWYVPADQAAGESVNFTPASREMYRAEGGVRADDGTRYRLAMGDREDHWSIFCADLTSAQVAAMNEAARLLGMCALSGDRILDADAA